MSHAVRVASVDEIPPGKGKLIEFGGHQVAVFNVAGQFFARRAPAPDPHARFGETECTQPGLHFDAYAEDSPADLLDEEPCALRIEHGAVWLELPER
jgi:hypothetical protein